jgi:hypothetical protein
MALPTTTVVEAAVQSLFDALAEFKTIHGGNMRAAVGALNEVKAALRQVYAVKVDFTVTDSTDATFAAFAAVTGELGVALGRPARPGDVFQVCGTVDTTDNVLGTAKGSAVADGDIFVVNAAGTGVTYLVDALASMAANETADFTFPA